MRDEPPVIRNNQPSAGCLGCMMLIAGFILLGVIIHFTPMLWAWFESMICQGGPCVA
jgi:hypothetical protein